MSTTPVTGLPLEKLPDTLCRVAPLIGIAGPTAKWIVPSRDNDVVGFAAC